MSYAAIDTVIREWANANVQTPFVEKSHTETRFCYLSSEQAECYQISVDAPENGLVRVHVSAIETIDDMEAHLQWLVPIAQLTAALDTAKKTIVENLWRRLPLNSE